MEQNEMEKTLNFLTEDMIVFPVETNSIHIVRISVHFRLRTEKKKIRYELFPVDGENESIYRSGSIHKFDMLGQNSFRIQAGKTTTRFVIL